MSVTSNKHPRPPASGITLVEILIVISVLVIIASFALPSAGTATARAELKAATEHVEHAIGSARNLARASETEVSLSIRTADDGEGQVLGLLDASRQPVASWQDYPVPETIRVVTDHESFVFDARGLVENPGRVLLLARADEDIQAELTLR